jgi:hypothetical protein
MQKQEKAIWATLMSTTSIVTIKTAQGGSFVLKLRKELRRIILIKYLYGKKRHRGGESQEIAFS